MTERSRGMLLYCLALPFAVAPLWLTPHIPMVDLPQHLHLISVLHRLQDRTTVFPQLFDLRGELTPYLGYYHAVSLLNWLVPETVANQLFLSAYVAGMALGMAFLLASLKRPIWPSLLALPFAYGDSFAWGFVNYCAALPLAFLCMGLFVRAIQDTQRQKLWAAALAVCLVAVLLFHVQAFAFLGLALPLLLVATSAPGDAAPGMKLKNRRWALAGVAPSVALFLIWVVGRLGAPAEIAPGQPWHAWGPIFSEQNLAYKSFAQNRSELFEVLANLLRSGTDRYALYAVAAIAVAAWLARVYPSNADAPREGKIERWRLLGVGAIALVLYFAMPFDIRGYMYYLNTRFAHLAAPLILAAVPALAGKAARWLGAASVAAALVLGVTLGRGFSDFAVEAAPLDALAAVAGPRPMVMGLIFDVSSGVVTHPVYLHAAAEVARQNGGASNFSFASTPHSPIKYRGEAPPTYPSEWNPRAFNYATMGRAYDDFLIRGASAQQVFGPLLESELYVAGEGGGFTLVRRR